MEAANPALLRLVCQTLFVICYNQAEALDRQQPDPAMRQSYAPQQLCRMQICKRLLIAMQVSIHNVDKLQSSSKQLQFRLWSAQAHEVLQWR